jgi:GNAT superfamily N-acetyltransferase
LEPKLCTDGSPIRGRRRLRRSGSPVSAKDAGGQQEAGPDEKVSAIERHVTPRQRSGSLGHVIRAGTPEDAEAVARVHVETWRVAYDHVFPREELERMATERVDRRAEMHRRSPPIVAEADGEIIGFVSVGPANDEDADGELYAIYVLPAHWGTGVGRDLIQTAEDRLRELGHEDAILWVLEDNPRARRFYEAAGWLHDGNRRPIEVFGIEVPEVRYAKPL